MNFMEKQNEKIGKLVALARNGIDGEKQAAIEILKKLCEKHDFNFDDVMSGSEEMLEYELKYKNGQLKLARGVIARYGAISIIDKYYIDKFSKTIYFSTTKQKFLETIHAYSILSRQYEKEKKETLKAFHKAFQYVNDLYYYPKEGEELPENNSTHDPDFWKRVNSISNGIKKAEIHLALKEKNS